MIKLSIVTVFKFGDITELYLTISSIRRQSVKPHEHVIVISGVSNAAELEFQIGNEFTRLIINQDGSLYNAMNIGMEASSGDALIFMNGGDEFIGNTEIEKIGELFQPGHCLALRTLQYYGDDIYIRPSSTRLADLYKWPNHQAFIAPLPVARSVKFDENKTISSDTDWMRAMIGICGISIDSIVTSKFALGGVSNSPTMRTVRTRFSEEGLVRGALEFVKLLLRHILRKKNYYRLILSYKTDRNL